MVVLSPPGMMRPSSSSSCDGRRTSLTLAPKLRSMLACSRAAWGIMLKPPLMGTDGMEATEGEELPMVQTRKQRERQADGLANAFFAVAVIAFLFGWRRFDSLLAGFLIGLAVVGLTIVGLRLLRRRRETALQHAGLGELEHMNGEQFEELLQAKFRAKGYRVTLTPNGADFGADLLLERDGTTTAVQAKHWRARKVGVRAVQEVAAAKAYYRADKAAVVTSGDYTDQAVQLARSNDIELWDRARMTRELMDRTRGTESTPATVANLQLQEEPQSTASPFCPRCGSAMVRRRGRHGPFWGCSEYPGCRGTLAV